MDNSPRFDEGRRVGAVDLASFLAIECEALAWIAGAIGARDRQTVWQGRRENLIRTVNSTFWDSRRGFFFDRYLDTGDMLDVMCCSGLYPLTAGAASADQARALVASLEDPTRFRTALSVPTIAAADTDNYSPDMWRGPVWVNVNWLVAYGAARYGYHDLAKRIRQETTQEVERMYLRYGTLFEFYDDRRNVDPPRLLRKGACDPGRSPYRQVFHDYGWTACLYLDMLLTE